MEEARRWIVDSVGRYFEEESSGGAVEEVDGMVVWMRLQAPSDVLHGVREGWK